MIFYWKNLLKLNIWGRGAQYHITCYIIDYIKLYKNVISCYVVNIISIITLKDYDRSTVVGGGPITF